MSAPGHGPAAEPLWDAHRVRLAYGPMFLGSKRLDRCLRQTGWPLTELVIAFARGLPRGARVLDAGAGNRVHAPAFTHCRYDACDIAQGDQIKALYRDDPRARYFTSDLTPIPRADESYDAILCTQVLEHVPDPQSAIREMARVLTPGGVVLLTTNGAYGIHMPPFHFYNTTPFSLIPMLAEAGLRVTHLAPRGGWFNMAGSTLPTAIDAMGRGPRARWLRRLVLPLTHIAWPVLCRMLDRFDDQKAFAESWDLIATRPAANGRSAFDASHLPPRMRDRTWHPDALGQRYPQMRGFTLDRSDRIAPLDPAPRAAA